MFRFSLIILVCTQIYPLMASEEPIKNSWKLQQEVQEIKKSLKNTNQQMRFGFTQKSIDELKIEANSKKFNYSGTNLPGISFQYDFGFNFISLDHSLYANASYVTKYNRLDSKGYADISAFDTFIGLGIGKKFFEEVQVHPKAFLGLGYGYYFQRGDVNEVSGDENFIQMEYGFAIDCQILKINSISDFWSEDYILGLKVSRYQNIDSKTDDSNGTQISAQVGIQI